MNTTTTILTTKMTRLAALAVLTVLLAIGSLAQSGSDDPAVRKEPDEIRGYKVQRAQVSVKREGAKSSDPKVPVEDGSDAMVQVGEPRLVSIRPFGITFEVPITVAALDKGGEVDFLVFEDIKVNGSAVTIEEFQQKFSIPNKKPADLPAPILVYISTPTALIGAVSEWRNSKETWPVSGRVYVFGRFKKFIFKFKRVVPIDFDLLIDNPLKSASATDLEDKSKSTDPAIKKN